MPNCPYCGPKTISHFPLWLENSLSIFLSPLDRLVLESPAYDFLGLVTHPLSQLFLKFLKIIKVAKLNPRLETSDNLRVKVLFEEAKKRNIKMQSIDVFGRNIDYFEAKIKNKTIVFNGLPRLPRKKNYGLWWMDDKEILKEKLSAAGLPVPKGKSFSQLKPLLAYFKKVEKPVIIKPRLGSRGRHTTTFIYTERDLEKAYLVAKKLCHWVLIEKHLLGPVYRGTVINGQLVGVLGGSPPQITGDDRHPIKELIKIKNRNKPEGVKDFVPTTITNEFLSRIGYTLESILPKNKNIDLTEKIGVNYGGTSFEITSTTHPGFKTALEKAATLVGDSILGFDFIAEDITRPPKNQTWGIIECNSLPFINLHHYPLIGKPINIAGFVWDLWI